MGRSCVSMRPRHSCVHAHQVDIQVQCAAEALNQGNGPCVSNCAADIIQRLAHDFRLAGKQEPERKRGQIGDRPQLILTIIVQNKH